MSRACKIKNIVNPEINEEFYREFEDSKLPPDWNQKKQLWMREDRLKNNAKDFVAYYSGAERMFMGKVMYVCLNKVACVLMKNYVQKYWKEEIERLKGSLSSSYSEENEEEIQTIKDKIKEMERTEMEIVFSDGKLNEEQIYDYDSDIEIPKNISERAAEKRFKNRHGNQDGNLKIVFVCAMWMTGFDVPCLSFLVLDKPLKAHTLMQAIARPNRVDKGKDRGFILDYLNCLPALKEALQHWGSVHGKNLFEIKDASEMIKDINNLVHEIESFLQRSKISLALLVRSNPEGKRTMLRNIKEKLLVEWTKEKINEKCEKLFLELKYVVKTDLSLDIYEKADAIRAIYKKLNADKEDKREGWQFRLTRILRKYIKADVNRENLLKEIGEKEIKELSKFIINSTNRKQIIFEDFKRDLLPKIQKNLKDNPTTINFFHEYNEIIEEWNEDIDSSRQEKVFEDLINLGKRVEEEVVRFKREGFLNVQELVIYDICKTKYRGDLQELKIFSVEFLAVMKNYLKNTFEPFGKDTTISEIKYRIKKIIFQKFPITLNWEDIKKIRDELYEYLRKVFFEEWIFEN